MEIWKQIEFIPTHAVSNLARVKRLSDDRIVKQSSLRGYKVFAVNCKTYLVHRIVAFAFIDNPEDKPFINHINSNRSDNSLTNLEWVTPRENAQHGFLSYKKSSKYTGVCYDKANKLWLANILHNKKRITIGRFATELDAYMAYLNAASNLDKNLSAI